MDYQTLIVTLVLGGYAFTAGSYVYTWNVFKILHNHERTKIKNHLANVCDDDCYYCSED